jgi:hypothetical protein
VNDGSSVDADTVQTCQAAAVIVVAVTPLALGALGTVLAYRLARSRG